MGGCFRSGGTSGIRLGINQPVPVTVLKPAETMDIMGAEYKANIELK